MLFRDADIGGKTIRTSEEAMPVNVRVFPCSVQEGVGWRKEAGGFGGWGLLGDLLYNFC